MLTGCVVVDYIPHDLDEQTKVLLRITMESPLTANVSRSSVQAPEQTFIRFVGEFWIYLCVRVERYVRSVADRALTAEVRVLRETDIATDRVVYYKVGRTDNVPRRLNEWTKRESVGLCRAVSIWLIGLRLQSAYRIVRH